MDNTDFNKKFTDAIKAVNDLSLALHQLKERFPHLIATLDEQDNKEFASLYLKTSCNTEQFEIPVDRKPAESVLHNVITETRVTDDKGHTIVLNMNKVETVNGAPYIFINNQPHMVIHDKLKGSFIQYNGRRIWL